MDSFTIVLLVGLAAVLMIAVIVKLRASNRPMGVAEKAEYLSKRRARMLPALAVIFLSQQANFFSQMSGGGHVSAEKAKINAWLVLLGLMRCGLATKGFGLERKERAGRVRDRTTRPHRTEGKGW